MSLASTLVQKSLQKYQMRAPNGVRSAPRFGRCLQNVDRCRQMSISPWEVGGGAEPTSALLLIRCRGLFLLLSIFSPPTHKHILICIYLLSLPVALNCSRDEGNRANCISINLLRVCGCVCVGGCACERVYEALVREHNPNPNYYHQNCLVYSCTLQKLPWFFLPFPLLDMSFEDLNSVFSEEKSWEISTSASGSEVQNR